MERKLEGIWIPLNIWEDKNLDMTEKGILTEIHYLDNEPNHCYASNEYLSKFCQCSESKVTRTITKLIELEYISLVSFDGRHRVLKSNLDFSGKKQSSQIDEAD
jgi:redox-regulated HSP33 family molecular chaperone